jgi:hypothetical protein
MERKRKLDIDTGAEGEPGANGGTIQENNRNMFTGKPYSTRYYDILSGRKGASCMVFSENAPTVLVLFSWQGIILNTY